MMREMMMPIEEVGAIEGRKRRCERDQERQR